MMLGFLDQEGLGRAAPDDDAPDYEAAARHYRLAAEAGNSNGMLNLALLHLSGSGVERDDGMAVKLTRQAAALDNGRAMALMGLYHEYGLIEGPDPEQALAWYRRSAEEGDLIGQFRLGLRLMDAGAGTAAQAEGFSWLLKAENPDYGEAVWSYLATGSSILFEIQAAARFTLQHEAYTLAQDYRHGRGVEQNELKALIWFNLASGRGHEEAKAEIVRLPDHRRRFINRRAYECRLQNYRFCN